MANLFDGILDILLMTSYDLPATQCCVAALCVLKYACVSDPRCAHLWTVLLLACVCAWLAVTAGHGRKSLLLLSNCAVAWHVVVLLDGWDRKSRLVYTFILFLMMLITKQIVHEEDDEEEIEDDEEIEETTVPEMCGLSQDLVQLILDHVPVKQLMRMKCLSKPWCSFISRYRRLPRPRRSTLLLCQYSSFSPDPYDEQKQHQILFLHPKEDEGDRTIENSCYYAPEPGVKFMAYSNGMFLLVKYFPQENKVIMYVNNKPVTVMINPCQPEWDTLPPIHNCYIDFIGVGLAFDGAPNLHYKVVCYLLDHDRIMATGCMEFQIFSSDTREWRKYRETILNFSNYSVSLSDICTPYLFWQGRMLCILNNNMLVHHLQDNTLEVMQLPKNDFCTDGLLWVSEGCLHYCCGYGSFIGFHVWKYVNNLWDKSTADRNQGWKLKHSARFYTSMARNPKKYGPFEDIHGQTRYPWFKPCAFDDDLQIMYLQLPRSILSYSFETRKLRRLWILEGQHATDSSFHCIHFNATNLPVGRDNKLMLPP